MSHEDVIYGKRKIENGYQVWFTIGNQSFHLRECTEDNEVDSLEVAEFYIRMLKIAFKKLNNK